MRKNTARHWLHAGLDLLPLILIPVFMIYSHRHDLSTDITIQQDVYKDFYQGVKNGKPTSLDYWQDNSSDYGAYTTLSFSNDKLKIHIIDFDELSFNIETETNFNLSNDGVIYFKLSYINTGNVDIVVHMYDSELEWFDDTFNFVANSDDTITYYADSTTSFYVDKLYFETSTQLQNVDVYFYDFQVFNLTEIFGAGNEPTKEVFESYLKQDYYDYGSNEVSIGTIDVPAKNNDIMSVFMDSFNNSINKYFNMGNVFGMNNVYQWFNTNIFNGQAPTIIFSVWNIVLYEFVMDLLFLLYALFMWFIDVTKRLIEKPLDSIK